MRARAISVLAAVLTAASALRAETEGPAPADVLTVGQVTVASGTGQVRVPVFLQDNAGTPIGRDKGAELRISGFAMQVTYGPNPCVDTPSAANARIEIAGGILERQSVDLGSRVKVAGTSQSWIYSSAESNGLIPFTAVAPPGDRIGVIVFDLQGCEAGTIDLIVTRAGAAAAMLTSGSGQSETAGNGLEVVNGAIRIEGSSGQDRMKPVLVGPRKPKPEPPAAPEPSAAVKPAGREAVSNVPEEPNVNLRSLFYDFVEIAETGSQFSALSDAPSINRSGFVAFQASTPSSGQGVWSSDGLSPIVDLTPGFDETTRSFGRGVMLSDAGDAIESDRFTGSPPPTFERTWPGTGSGTFTTLGRGGTGQPFDSVLSHPALSANGSHWAFTALNVGSTVTELVTPLGLAPLLGNQGTGYRPMVADDGSVVLRDTSATLRRIKLFRGGDPAVVATVANEAGFTQLGNQPGISDSGKIIAFSGDRGNGPGVFIAYEETPGTFTIARVAGEASVDQGNRPDLGFTDPGDGLPEVGISFGAIDFNSRVAVMHQERGPAGLDGDTVVVAFIGTPQDSSVYPRFGNYPGLFFANTSGLFTTRLDFRKDPPPTLQLRRRYAIPVAQIGDTIDGLGISGFVISSLAVHDPLAEATTDDAFQPLHRPAGSHRVAFWASNGSKQVILRGTHVNSCLLAVRHYSQCDDRWRNKPYVATGLGFCAKACALTAQTMSANYGADFYDINAVSTPAEVHDFVRPRKGFKGNGVNFVRSIQALRKAGGLLSLQPNTLRFVAKRISVLPNSSQARVDSARQYIDDRLCDDENPAPVLLGADRERDGSKLVAGHFIIASGIVNSRRFISDPGYANGILFSQGPTGNPISTKYEKNFETRGVVVDPPDLGGMTIAVDGAGTLLVKDSLGRQTGFVGSDEPDESIPDSTFFLDGLRNLDTTDPIGDQTATFLIGTPGVGTYKAKVIGTGTGSFTLSADVIDADGNLADPMEATDTIAPGQVKTYLVNPSGGGSIKPVGDANGDGSVNTADVFYLISFLFAGGPAPIGPSDVNGDVVVNTADVFYLINHIFAGGPAPL